MSSSTRTDRRHWWTLVSLPTLLFGLAFLAVGIWTYGEITPDSGDTVVTGIAVDVSPSRGSEGGTVYAPVVEYQDPTSGEVFQAVGSIRSSSRPDIGDTWQVAYPPGQPEEGKVVGQTWFAWIFIAVGSLVLVVMAGGAVSCLRRGESPGEPIQDAIYRGPEDAPQSDPSPVYGVRLDGQSVSNKDKD